MGSRLEERCVITLSTASSFTLLHSTLRLLGFTLPAFHLIVAIACGIAGAPSDAPSPSSEHLFLGLADYHFSEFLQLAINTIRTLAHPNFNFTFSPALAPTPTNIVASPLATIPTKLSDIEKRTLTRHDKLHLMDCFRETGPILKAPSSH
jgi:hypothetical protein